jgi:hypothetical protein
LDRASRVLPRSARITPDRLPEAFFRATCSVHKKAEPRPWSGFFTRCAPDPRPSWLASLLEAHPPRSRRTPSASSKDRGLQAGIYLRDVAHVSADPHDRGRRRVPRSQAGMVGRDSCARSSSGKVSSRLARTSRRHENSAQRSSFSTRNFRRAWRRGRMSLRGWKICGG